MSPQRLRSRGFTLVEMLVVVALVGILSAAALPLVEHTVQRQREHALRRALRELRTGIDAYKQAVDEGRIARAADASGYPPTLLALVQGVPDAKSAKPGEGQKQLYFLRRLPRDPFAPPELPAEQTWALRSYGSPPDAPRAGVDVFDVASRSRQRALDGSWLKDW
jgi:general secretion pathway protein G